MPSSSLALSVVIPAYNAAATLPDLLEALAKQTVPASDFEVLIVDDGSTDATAEIAHRAGVRVISQQNQGPASARNHGAREAHGKIVVFTDSDCAPDPGWLAAMAAPFDDPEVMGVQGAYRTEQTALAARFAQLEFEDRYDLMRCYPTIDLVATYAAAFPRAIFLRMGGFDTSFPKANNEDTEFSYRLVAAGYKLVFADGAIVRHLHPDTVMEYLRIKFSRAYWRLIVYRRYPEKAVKDRYTTKMVKLQTLAAAAAIGALVLSPLAPELFCASLVLFAGIMASATPLAKRAQADAPLARACFPLVLGRSIVFAVGSLWAVFDMLRKKR
ncbi:glycosyltransferase [Desulfovibrio inopinatus]|uniref:glycosyltransferase n=1 Tax=Desulfovibrio inopinatus TaxID=102109 RepID=UPI0004007435|nr:glycosyltransferase [Desulfovibrio inopinatus]